MLGAGTVINPIIRIVTAVAILAAVYFFIVKPALDTTEDAFNSVGNSLPDFDSLSSDIQSQVDTALGNSSDPDRLRACLKRAIEAGGNEARIDRCVERFSS